MSSNETRKDQFIGRASSGLLPEDKAKSEAQVRAYYFQLTVVASFVIGPILAFGWYFLVTTLVPSQTDLIQVRLSLLRDYDLIYVYIGYYIIYLARAYAIINANGARGPARVDRPCQHVYQIYAESGPLANAPYVVMVNDSGQLGRFNRAQRAAFNLDSLVAELKSVSTAEDAATQVRSIMDR